jgi:hypothetical protein
VICKEGVIGSIHRFDSLLEDLFVKVAVWVIAEGTPQSL